MYMIYTISQWPDTAGVTMYTGPRVYGGAMFVCGSLELQTLVDGACVLKLFLKLSYPHFMKSLGLLPSSLIGLSDVVPC